MDIKGFEIYGPFGRIIRRFPIGADELHHHALARAQEFARTYAGRCWLRVYRN